MTKSLAKKVDGTYTRMLRRVKNVSWRAHMSNEQLYGPIPKLSATIKRRRLTLAGHVFRHKEPAGSLIFWAPKEPRRRGRPNTTLIDVLKSDTGLNNDEMRAAMTDRSIWKTNFIMSPDWCSDAPTTTMRKYCRAPWIGSWERHVGYFGILGIYLGWALTARVNLQWSENLRAWPKKRGTIWNLPFVLEGPKQDTKCPILQTSGRLFWNKNAP